MLGRSTSETHCPTMYVTEDKNNGLTHRADHDLLHTVHPTVAMVVVLMCCAGSVKAQIQPKMIQPRKHVLDHGGYSAPARQHELDHTDHTDQE